MIEQGENDQIVNCEAGVISTGWLLLLLLSKLFPTSMNRKLLYSGLVLINLLPFIYRFVVGYSLETPFVNLFAFVSGQEYNVVLLILVLLALLLSVVLVFTSASATTLSSAKKHVILHSSDGQRIAEENQQKVLHLQLLLQEVQQEQMLNVKRLPADSGLDMNIS